MTPTTKNMTVSDSSMCMTDATCKMEDGTTMTMKGGQGMINGKMNNTMDVLKKGDKMKCSGKLGTMKM